MSIIRKQEEFNSWLEDNQLFYAKLIQEDSLKVSNFLKTEDTTFINIDFENQYLTEIDFISCRFVNCRFKSTVFAESLFQNCFFRDCLIQWSKLIMTDLINCEFDYCRIVGLELANVTTEHVLFNHCREILDLYIRKGSDKNISFDDCYIAFLHIECSNSESSLSLTRCSIQESNFNSVNFLKSKFTNCDLRINSFSNCIFAKETFINSNKTVGQEFNLLDLRTIVNSENQNSNVLTKLFGIYNDDVKDYLIGLTSEVVFQSIFISYSFEDREFAQMINYELLKRGVLTFLWEKDAPGGKKLTEIMSKGIRHKDRVLFIASKNSLRSKACHFELTEGRRKQEELWEDVLFPIHIDNFLFELKKEDIRPLEKQKEYWKNIEELKRINSIDFIKFCNVKEIDSISFQKQFFKLISGLRKDK